MKKIVYALFAVAIMLTGCAKDSVDVAETQKNNPANLIAIAPSTTRAGVNKVENMQADAVGFKAWVVSTENAATPVWYSDGTTTLDGSVGHVYSAGEWGFTTPVAWPETPSFGGTAGFPLNFYGLYPSEVENAGKGAMITAIPSIDGDGSMIIMDYTVQPAGATDETANPAASQVDVLSGRTMNVLARPASSTVSMTFDHILSKVDFGVIADYHYRVAVQAIGVKNVANVGSFSVGKQQWLSQTGSYASYNYFNRFFPNGDGASVVAPKTFVGVPTPAAAGFFAPVAPATDHSAHLMLLPQDMTTYMWDGTAAALSFQAYIQLIYRAENILSGSLDPNYIGFTSAVDHPDYDAMTDTYTGPLFVKVGYPFVGNWEMGKGYTYNIQLPGTTGGQLIDEYYYDENGNRTDFEVIGVDVPDNIIGDDYIHIIPEVTTWSDATPSVLQ